MGLTEEELLEHFTGIAFLVRFLSPSNRSPGTAWATSTAGAVR